MASGKGRQQGGGGCALLVAAAIALTAVVWGLSSIGHVLGLTPTFGEATDRPDGWVTDHYEHVVWGYLLTVVVLVAVLAALGLAVRALDRQTPDAWRPAGGAGALLLVVALVPVGRRSDTVAAAHAAARKPIVPEVTGLLAAKARDALDDAGLSARFRREPANDHRCRVFSQRPAAGARAQDGADVALRCRAHIPRVVRRSPDTAELRIEDAGFRPSVVDEPGDGDRSRCHVRSQSRSGLAEPETRVRLRLACRPKPPPAPVAEPAPAEPSCDPSYEGACLDPASSDYDCAGGSGDGPDYTGTVTVVGRDHFGLDRDGNGVGCE